MLALKSRLTQDALAYLFLHEGAAMYVNELARRIGHESGNVTRKLMQLEREGVLKSEMRGKQKYYSLNPSFPLLKEYRQIVLKSFGLEALLKEAVRAVPGIQKAFLFGSYVENKMDMASDIDLLVIGKHKALELQKAVTGIQKKIDREINVVNLTPAEYDKRRRTDPFLKSVERKPRISLL